LGEIFYNTDARGKIWSTAFGIPLEHVNTVYNLMLELNNTVGPFAGVFAFRYVKRSAATLAFTRFSPTCVVEIDGVDSSISKQYYDALWQALLDRNIPHAFHWGKMHNLNRETLQAIYGTGRDSWIEARNRLLRPELLSVFNNETLQQWGLADVKNVMRPV
jgi:hypothetical protein